MSAIRIYLVLFLLITGPVVRAATPLLNPTAPVSVSPSTASFAEYGTTSVNPYSGTPFIELPLVSLNVGGGHSWPISIAYNCSGLKVNQPGGIVGAGWTLKSGGVIVASRNDIPDEFKDDVAAYGWYYKHDLANIAYDNSGSVASIMNSYARSDRLFDDTEPDMFNFSFLDYQGTFFIGEDGQWKVRCNKDVKVVFRGIESDFTDPYGMLDLDISDTRSYLGLSGGHYSKSFGRFTLIDENGNEYVFGGSNESIEYYIPFFTEPDNQFVASAWHLTKVRYTDGRTITFKYSSDRPYIAQLTYNKYFYSSHTLSSGGFFDSDCIDSRGQTAPIYSGNLIIPVYLTDIESDEDSVSFEYDTDNSVYYDFRTICDSRLDQWIYGRECFLQLLVDVYKSIEPHDCWYPICLDVLERKKLTALKHSKMHNPGHRLDFGYYEGNYLILTTITDDILGDKYRFATYGIDDIPPMSLEKGDAWGYYKGLDYQSQDSESSRYGMLERIMYTTDGYTRFEYERHDYSSVVTELRDGITYESKNRLAGGLRIKRIYQNGTNNEGDEFLDKEYHYIKDYNSNKNSTSGVSSGCLLQPPLYSYSFTATSIDGSRHSVAFSTVQSLACHDGSSTEGHIGYSEVVEKNADGSVNLYKFTDFASYPDERPVAELLESKGVKPCSYRSHERGLLKEKYRYLPDGRLWKRTIYSYSPSGNPDKAYAKCLHLWGDMLCKGGKNGNGMNVGSWIYDGVAYKRYYYVMRPTKISETEYDDRNNSFTTVTSLEYVPGTLGLIRSKCTTYGRKSDTMTYAYSYEGDAYFDKVRKDQHVLAPLAKESVSLSSPFFNGKVASTVYSYSRLGDSYLRPDSVYFSGYGGKPGHVEKYRYGRYYTLESRRTSGTPEVNYISAFNGLRTVAEYTGDSIGALSSIPGGDDNPDYLSLAAKLQGRDFMLYKYDYFGRLIESAKVGAAKKEYGYDAAHRLVEEKIDDIYYKGYQYYTALGNNPGPRPEYGRAGIYNFILTNSRGAVGYDNRLDYYDGLGRNVGSVKVGFGNDNEDNISIIENNPDGTPAREYLPAPVADNSGEYRHASTCDFSIYGNDKEHAFTSYTYSGREGEPPVRINLPGAAWHDSRGKSTTYLLVTNPGRYCVIQDGELKISFSAYSSGELRMTENVDEDGKRTQEIRNRHGLVVRTIMYDDDDPIMTDYVYDEKDNLRYVLPPEVMARVIWMPEDRRIDGTELNDLCYVYTYDECNRLATKKLPHCNTETYYYDAENLLRLSQSAAQSVSGEWSFYHYDDMLRPVYKYTFHADTPPNLHLLTNLLKLSDGCKYDAYDPADSYGFYGYKPWNYTFKVGIPIRQSDDGELEWVNYYDGVTPGDIIVEHADSMAYRHYPVGGTPVAFRGQLSGRLVRVPADSMFIATAIYHDSIGRVIQEVSSNILGGYDRKMTAYHSCLTVPKQTVETHSTPDEWHTDIYDYEYGLWSRLMRMWMTHDDGPRIELLRNRYDALGRLASQTLGDSITTEYTYNLHSSVVGSTNPWFSQRLYYEKGPDESVGCLNGDISAFRWRSAADGGRVTTGDDADGLWRGYTYTYDGADRLVSAVYGEMGSRPSGIIVETPDYSEYRTYDARGNLLTLKAYGLTDRQKTAGGGTSLSFGVIKDIGFGNVGSQMVSATIAPNSATVSTMDNSVIGALKEETTFGFNYDAAGNLTGDGLRKETFEYDRFGNLSYAFPENGRRADYKGKYIYDASGRLHGRSLEFEQIRAELELPGGLLPDSLWIINPPFYPRPNPGDSSVIIPNQGSSVHPIVGQESYSDYAASSQSTTIPGITLPRNPRDSTSFVIASVPHASYEYCGNYEYSHGRLDRINTPVGYYKNGRHYFYVKDYQGNVRCVVADNDSLISAVHYYPSGSLFGESHGYWRENNLFQGGKLEKSYSHTFYDLQNRHYDPILPHFTSVDKKAESYYPFSFYNYSLCNPVRYRDPTGLEPTKFEAALMCGMAYHDDDYKYYIRNLNNTGWKEVDASSPLIKGYDFHGTLFMRQKEDKLYEFAYAYPGTNSFEDGIEDVAQLIGLSTRYSSTIKVAEILSKRFTNFELTFLGHSLGGGEAAASSIKTGRLAITFNPAALSITTRVKHNLNSDGNIINYITYKQNSNGSISMADAVNVGQSIYDMKLPGEIIPIIIDYKNGIDAHRIKTIIEYLKP